MKVRVPGRASATSLAYLSPKGEPHHGFVCRQATAPPPPRPCDRRHGGDRRRRCSAARDRSHARLRGEREDHRSEHVDEPRSRRPSTRSPRSRSRTSSDRALRGALQAGHLRIGAAPLNFQVGYYTEVAGLGSSPNDVTVNGTIDCLQPVLRARRLHRARELLALRREPDDQRRGQGRLSVRRVLGDVAGHVAAAGPRQRLRDADGLLLATRRTRAAASSPTRSSPAASVVNGSQQQYLVSEQRSRRLDERRLEPGLCGRRWERPPKRSRTRPTRRSTTNPESREKPFLYVDSNDNFRVYVPDVQFNGRGTTWQNGQTPGHSVSIDDFFIAKPSDSVQAINNALAQGKNLIFTPGIYNVDQTIKVKRRGHGGAGARAGDARRRERRRADDGRQTSRASRSPGSSSRPARSTRPCCYGSARSTPANGQARDRSGWSDPSDPTALHDVYFRIGGPHVGKATVSLEANADNDDPGQHLGVASRPRQRRRLDQQHG